MGDHEMKRIESKSCGDCEGMGYPPGYPTLRCKRCNGQRIVPMSPGVLQDSLLCLQRQIDGFNERMTKGLEAMAAVPPEVPAELIAKLEVSLTSILAERLTPFQLQIDALRQENAALGKALIEQQKLTANLGKIIS